MKKSWLADAYNRISQWRNVRVPAKNILLLLPRCLQHDACIAKVSRSIEACDRCKRCDLAEIAALQEQYGFQALIASGGRQAVAAARQPSVKVIIAVACAKELMFGILGVFPKPVLSVYNRLSNGPCVNTRVDTDELERVLKKTLSE